MTTHQSNDEPLFFGYFTPGPYADEAKCLGKSLAALGLEHNLIPLPDQGGWQANTQAKGRVVAEMISHNPGRRLVYLDVDAVVIRKPELFWTLDCDFAAVLFDPTILLSGTLFMRANERTAALVNRWRELNYLYPVNLPDGRAAWDQRTLHMAIKEKQSEGLKFEELPQSYTWMVGQTQAKYPDVAPIILHTVRSQEYGERLGRTQ